MIAKIKTRADFGGIVNYANDQKNKKKSATLLEHEGICAINNKTIADSFQIQASMRPKVKSPVKHVSLAFSPQDTIRFPNDEKGNALMVEIAKKWMEQMGIRNTQYIIARHHDTKHPHCHLVFNRIDNDGNLISDSNERIRNTKVCRALTKKYGLYHISNSGICSKYDQAKYVLDKIGWTGKLGTSKTEDFNLPAKRSKFSKLDSTKLENMVGEKIPSWQDAIDRFLEELN